MCTHVLELLVRITFAMPPGENQNSLGICLGRKGCHSNPVQNCLEIALSLAFIAIMAQLLPWAVVSFPTRNKKGLFPFLAIFSKKELG